MEGVSVTAGQAAKALGLEPWQIMQSVARPSALEVMGYILPNGTCMVLEFEVRSNRAAMHMRRLPSVADVQTPVSAAPGLADVQTNVSNKGD